MFNVLIFSRNRAMQLDATLRSFYLHCIDSQLARIQVLYSISGDLHSSQYELLKKQFRGVDFVKQTEFRTDVLNLTNPLPQNRSPRFYDFLVAVTRSIYQVKSRLLKKLIRHSLGRLCTFFSFGHPEDLVLFMVDDNIFTADFRLADVKAALASNRSAIGFSLRLGLNTTYCYMLDQPQKTPKYFALDNDIISYPWRDAEFDYGYPLEISSSIYRIQDLLGTMLGLPFDHPNELEAHLATSVGLFARKLPELLCYTQSVTFCNPSNIVQQVFSGNRSSDNRDYSVDKLALRFERGERILVEAYSGFIPNSCHQDVGLVFNNVKSNSLPAT